MIIYVGPALKLEVSLSEKLDISSFVVVFVFIFSVFMLMNWEGVLFEEYFGSNQMIGIGFMVVVVIVFVVIFFFVNVFMLIN